MKTDANDVVNRLPYRSGRRETGKGVRRFVSRRVHSRCERPDSFDAVDLLVAQDAGRVADLVPIRHGRMSNSPFHFYRGAAAIMAADLASLPATTGLDVQLCGDAHLGNFGLFYSADRRLIFDINDFDETLEGPFEYDVKRLATSVYIAARSGGCKKSEARKLAKNCVVAYQKAMAELSDTDPLDLHYARIEIDGNTRSLLGKADLKKLDKLVKKASTKTRFAAFSKLATSGPDGTYLVAAPPLIMRFSQEELSAELEFIESAIDHYRTSLPAESARLLNDRYELIDAAAKVVGVGSVGTRCLIALLMTPDGEPLILQVKEASESVLEQWLATSGYDNAGERVVRGQQRIQSAPDIFLGWTRVERNDEVRDFYIRQLWDGKASPSVDSMSADELTTYGGACGAALALAHARTGDAAAISGYMGRSAEDFPEAVSRFAAAYYKLNQADAAEHLSRIGDGSIIAIDDI